jgi:hypothetical protein
MLQQMQQGPERRIKNLNLEGLSAFSGKLSKMMDVKIAKHQSLLAVGVEIEDASKGCDAGTWNDGERDENEDEAKDKKSALAGTK